jgi:hypothetical protein
VRNAVFCEGGSLRMTRKVGPTVKRTHALTHHLRNQKQNRTVTQPTAANADPEAIRHELSERTLALCKIPSETGHEALIAEWVEGSAPLSRGRNR